MALIVEEDEAKDQEEVHVPVSSRKRKDVESFPSSAKLMPIPSNDNTLVYITGVKKSQCDEREWHIARLPKRLSKACFAQHSITRKVRC